MKKSGDLKRCIKSANEFLSIALYCREKQKESKFELNPPLFVNGALACELYMKAIIMSESPDSTYDSIHRLQELFHKLDIETQRIIENNYNQNVKQISLQDFLIKYNNNFVEWRYSFEDGTCGHPIAIIGFAESLQKYARGISDGEIR